MTTFRDIASHFLFVSVHLDCPISVFSVGHCFRLDRKYAQSVVYKIIVNGNFCLNDCLTV